MPGSSAFSLLTDKRDEKNGGQINKGSPSLYMKAFSVSLFLRYSTLSSFPIVQKIVRPRARPGQSSTSACCDFSMGIEGIVYAF